MDQLTDYARDDLRRMAKDLEDFAKRRLSDQETYISLIQSKNAMDQLWATGSKSDELCERWENIRSRLDASQVARLRNPPQPSPVFTSHSDEAGTRTIQEEAKHLARLIYAVVGRSNPKPKRTYDPNTKRAKLLAEYEAWATGQKPKRVNPGDWLKDQKSWSHAAKHYFFTSLNARDIGPAQQVKLLQSEIHKERSMRSDQIRN